MKEEKGVKQDVELTAEDLKTLAGQFKAEYKEKIGADFPSDAKEQLIGAVKAVFRSWDNPRANVYRRDNDIPYSWGTAVNVQMMAFGNMGDDCGTVLHSHVTRLQEQTDFSVSSLQTHRARTLLPAFVHRCTSPRWSRSSRKLSHSSKMCARLWRHTTEICRIWSLL